MVRHGDTPDDDDTGESGHIDLSSDSIKTRQLTTRDGNRLTKIFMVLLMRGLQFTRASL